MRFEERELKDYAEPVSVDALQEGSVYFALNFQDYDLRLPYMETRVFVGTDLVPGDMGRLYFQDVHSYLEGNRYNVDSEWPEFHTTTKDRIKHFFEFEGALEGLLKCSLNRRGLYRIPLRFEARDLGPRAEPVSATTLEVGEHYFEIRFVDEDMLIPTMETVVFAGRNLEAGDIGKFYFQDAPSYKGGVRYGPDAEDEGQEILALSEEEIDDIFEFERALDELMKCSLRRRRV